MNSHNSSSIKYDSKTERKINSAKSNRIEYRVIVQSMEGKYPECPSNEQKNYRRLTIVVDKNGNFIKDYYG